MDQPARGFASDNCSGAHPLILEAITRANYGHQPSYGADVETARLDHLAREEFGPDARIFPMLNGTGTNVAALRALATPHQAVICAETAHLAIDETAAPEAIAGLKLLGVPTADGKLDPTLAASRLADAGDLPHVAWPRVVSISQPTEVGTVYRPEEIRTLAEFAGEHDLFLHMDGARIFNAAASLGTGLAGASTDHGVDLLSLGANKNGTVFGEAVVFARSELAEGFEVLRKGSLQLASKARFVSAQLNALLEAGQGGSSSLGIELANRANQVAGQLGETLAGIDGVEVVQPVEANIVFITLPMPAARQFVAGLDGNRPLLFELGELGLIRLVASWDSTEADVERAAGLVEAALVRPDRPGRPD